MEVIVRAFLRLPVFSLIPHLDLPDQKRTRSTSWKIPYTSRTWCRRPCFVSTCRTRAIGWISSRSVVKDTCLAVWIEIRDLSTSSLSSFLQVQTHVEYLTSTSQGPERRRTIKRVRTVNTALPLAVNVQDYFRGRRSVLCKLDLVCVLFWLGLHSP